MKIFMRKKFKGKEAFRPIISVNEKREELQSGNFILVEESDSGRFVLNPDDGKTYFVSNNEFEKCASQYKEKVKKEKPIKRKIYVTRY